MSPVRAILLNSPGLHIGLCPHSTLGYVGVSCLKALVISLNFDVVALRYVYELM